MDLSMRTLPTAAGLRLPHPFLESFSKEKPSIPWVEFCTSYGFISGGKTQYLLQRVAEDYPVTMNDQVLSLGSAEVFDTGALNKLKRACDTFQPVYTVIQLGWSRWHNHYLHDNLPIPYTSESLQRVQANISKIQETLKQVIHIENPARLFQFSENNYPEQDFIETLCRTTGCRLRLNINSLYVSAINLGLNPIFELSRYPLSSVDLISVSGHEVKQLSEDWVLLMNSLNTPVAKPVWRLASQALKSLKKPVPISLAWEQNLPAFSRLCEEVDLADKMLVDTFSKQSEFVV